MLSCSYFDAIIVKIMSSSKFAENSKKGQDF